MRRLFKNITEEKSWEIKCLRCGKSLRGKEESLEEFIERLEVFSQMDLGDSDEPQFLVCPNSCRGWRDSE